MFFGNNEKLPDRREKHPITVAYLRKKDYTFAISKELVL